MKKELFALILTLSIVFCQCQNKSTLIAKETHSSSTVVDSLRALIEAKTQQGQPDSAAQLHVSLGYEYYNLYQFQDALKAYQTADALWKNADAKRYAANIADNYLNIAGLYNALGDYPLAINYQQQALTHFLAVKNTDLLIDTYLNMGVAGLRARDSSKIDVLKKGLTLIGQQKKPNLYLKAVLSQCLGKALNDFSRDYAPSLGYLNAASTYFQTNKDTANIAETTLEIARNYQHQNNYLAANKEVKTALSLRLQRDKGKTVECYQVLGEIAEAQQNPDSALFFYQKSLKSLDSTFTNDDVLINPTINAQTFNRKIELINVLARKIGPLSILYEKTKNQRYLTTALQTCQLADKVVQVLRREMHDDQAKYFWNETALPIYKKSLDIAAQLYDVTQNETYKLAVLQFSERTKAPVLREGIADNQAKSFAGVPVEQRQRERTLQAKMAILEKITNNETAAKRLVETRTQLYAFQDSLVKNYPTYARYLHATMMDNPLSINDLKGIQHQLSDSMLIIEYAFGNNTVYAIGISKTDYHIFKKPLNNEGVMYKYDPKQPPTGILNFDGQIHRFIQSVSNVEALKKDFAGTGKDYSETSFDLYQRLLEAPLTHFNAKNTIKRIQIVPEGALHLLSFKALTDQPVAAWMDNYPKYFLVRKYAFSSLFSLTSMRQTNPLQSNQDKSESTPQTDTFKLGCFGVDFKDSTLWRPKTLKTAVGKKNNPLIHAEPEIKGIAGLSNGHIYFNQTATKAAFLKEAPQYNVLHITTHGYPEGLVFQKTNPTDSSNDISISDIYGLSLNTHFTFLSACETGQGQLNQAEGVMSLGRAFTYAGAQSVMMSQWSIPDGATADIAKTFYEYCGQGLPKDVAEQRAEIDFLNKASDTQLHPNNWAALTLIGDVAPLVEEKPRSDTWIWALIGLLAVVCLAVWFRLRAK